MADSRKSRSIDSVTAAVADCLGRYGGGDGALLVCLSGGVDSVVLLHAIKATGRSVKALHVHHGLSPNADAWATFCSDLCTRWSVPLTIERVEVERNSPDGLEAAARRARHAVFARSVADWVLLAHHRGDRAETMLFNLMRGSGVRGAGAMPECSGRLVRPLLTVGRQDIEAYAHEHGLTWVQDESNADVRYSRNFLRHEVIPKIGERFPAVEKRLSSSAERFAEAADLLDELAQLDLGDEAARFPVSVATLSRLSEPRARNVLRYLLAISGVGIPGEERLVEALRQFISADPDRHPALAFGDYELRRQKGLIVLVPR